VYVFHKHFQFILQPHNNFGMMKYLKQCLTFPRSPCFTHTHTHCCCVSCTSSQDQNLDLWMNSEASVRTFGRCKVADKSGSVKSRSCTSKAPLGYACLVVRFVHDLFTFFLCVRTCPCQFRCTSPECKQPCSAPSLCVRLRSRYFAYLW